jgi:hypothetical protein
MKDLNIKTKKLKLFAKIKHTKLELLALLGPCCHQVIGSHMVISRVDALYVPITDRFLCLMSIAQSRKPSKNQYSVFTLQR